MTGKLTQTRRPLFGLRGFVRNFEWGCAHDLGDRAAAETLRADVYRLVAPLGVETFTRCKFGLNLRRVMPVTLVPTPPKYFCLPRVVT